MSNGGIEVTLIAKYRSYLVKADDILREAKLHHWAPATTEFTDTARQGVSTNVFEVGSAQEFLNAIQIVQEGGQRGQPRPRSV